MGKASKWLRGLFNLNKKPPTTQPSPLSSSPSCLPTHKPPKKKWSFIKPNKENNYTTNTAPETSQYDGISTDPTKQAMAVAAATAAAAEVAVAAASQAAAEVVRLTSSGRSTTISTNNNEMFDWKEDVSSTLHVNGRFASYWAAVKIQSYFRAYLAARNTIGLPTISWKVLLQISKINSYSGLSGVVMW
ncbi:hypothetical protein LIER_43257 [Lithospermum erythrorhizon]|uniref:Uncharacterized protein n=1 Tax=Lithospermum erythrorhizon TaxID=34254 RepID=A0AAV3PQJ7_LITER